MSLLEVEQVGRRYGRGSRERHVLHDVSLQIEPGEMVAVWGRRHSGRSTLLRLAAGIERPDEGLVRFLGCDLAGPGGDSVRGEIGYCRTTFRPSGGQLVLDQVITGQLTRGASLSAARARARSALGRVGAKRHAALRTSELDGGELVRVAIARALVHRPKLLVIDEPTLGVDLLVRDAILSLLRSIADDGTAVLASAAETTGLAGADRALSLSDGQLRGELEPPAVAPVIPIARAAGWAGSA